MRREAKQLCVIHPDFGDVPKVLRDRLSRAGYCVVRGDPKLITVVQPLSFLPNDLLLRCFAKAVKDAQAPTNGYPSVRALLGHEIARMLAEEPPPAPHGGSE